jgi:hypothetical protein
MENFPSNITDKRTVSYASLRTRHGPLIGGRCSSAREMIATKKRRIHMKKMILSFIIVFAVSGVIASEVFAIDEALKKFQEWLLELKYDPGKLDGYWGPRTESAVKEYLSDLGLRATGKVDKETCINIDAYERCLFGVVKELRSRTNARVFAAFDINAHEYFGFIQTGNTRIKSSGTPVHVLKSLQSMIEGKDSTKPIVYRCKQSTIVEK